MTAYSLFLEPLDVLFLRGNKLFGDPGSFGESLVPPWPSVAAGALRSRMLADARIDPAAFARGDTPHPELGTPTQPGSFAVAAFHLARRFADGRIEILVTPPADLVVSENDDGTVGGVRTLKPHSVSAAKIVSSAPFAHLPVLAETTRSKPATGYWLTEAGWRAYLAGQTPTADQLVKTDQLWRIDSRIGVGLEAATRRASDGRLFSTQAVVMTKQGHRIGKDKQTKKPILADYDTGFLAVIHGATPPQSGSVRLGGDGRAAAIHPVQTTLPQPDYAAIAQARRCRLVLTSPGIFTQGWLPTGVTRAADGTLHFDLHGVKARLVCAAVPRAEVISGWDLARWQPKPAQRTAPDGSVYWLDELEASAEALGKLAAAGLWNEPCEDAARRAEGFNRFSFSVY